MTFKKSVLQCTSIALLIALICGFAFSCPVFAVDSFEVLPVTTFDISDLFDNGLKIISTSYYQGVYCGASISDVYVLLYTSGSGVDSRNIYRAFSLSPFSSYRYFYHSGASEPQYFTDTASYNEDFGFYEAPLCNFASSAVTENNILPVYESQSVAYQVASDFLESGGSSSGDLITASSYFGVPAGYAAYIEIPSSSTDWDITVTQEFDEYSSLFGGQWSPMTSLWGFQSSLPSGSGNFSKSGLTVIPMYKMKPYTVLGQSKTGFSNKSTMVANGFWQSTPSAKYLVIYNPVIRAVSGTVGGASIADNVYVYNKGISVTLSGFYSPVKYYKLESSVTTSGLESSPADGTFEDSEYTETFDTDGYSEGIVNSSGDSSTLTDGGGDLIPSATSIGDYVRNLNQTLNNFASNFIDLMTSPISHVQQLINAGTNYFNVIQGLYGWLPDEVHAVVKSGMVVALSIGVISVLL